MLLKLTISELKIKPATSPHPPLPTISQLTYTAQQVGGLLKWVGARGHSIAERKGSQYTDMNSSPGSAPISSVNLSKSWDLLSFYFLISEWG